MGWVGGWDLWAGTVSEKGKGRLGKQEPHLKGWKRGDRAGGLPILNPVEKRVLKVKKAEMKSL